MHTVPNDLKQFDNYGQDPNHPQNNDHYDSVDDEYVNENGERFQASKDAVEGTKNFGKAYDKLVAKFYNEEGANLLIPQEDMMYHEFKEENKPQFNIEERQKKYAEQERKKQEKIRQAQIEKERKEMEECSFAPKLYKKRSTVAKEQDSLPRKVKTNPN